jgi:hypothetical protein
MIGKRQGCVVTVTLTEEVKAAIEKRMEREPQEFRKAARWVALFIRKGLVADGLLPLEKKKEDV